MTTTDTPRDTTPAAAALLAGLFLTGFGVAAGFIAQTQGHIWTWAPAVMVGTGVAALAYAFLGRRKSAPRHGAPEIEENLS
jgi:membrane protein implicated in regulation of membrane protease activity